MKKYILSVALLAITSFVAAQTSKSAFIHMKSGEVKEISCADVDSITFGNHVSYDKNIEAKYTMGVYNGKGQYVVQLSDAPMDDDGLPTQKGQTIVRFNALNENDPDSRNAVLPEGTYTEGSSFDPYTLYVGDSFLCALVCTEMTSEGPDGYNIPFVSATARVKHNESGYYIEFTGDAGQKYDGVDFQTLRMTYNGELKFINMDPAAYDKLADDVTMVPTMLSGRYTVTENYGNYSFALLNCPLDGEGYIIGAGELANFELLTAPSATMNINDIAGEYTIASVTDRPYNPGSFLSGTLYEYYGMYIPMGTYYTTYDNSGSNTNMYAFITGGSVKVETDGTNVTFDCNLETENGKHVKINYTAPASGFTDMSQPSSNVAPATRSGLTKFRPFGASKVFNHAPALQLVRK